MDRSEHPRWDEFHDRLRALMIEFAEVVGPRPDDDEVDADQMDALRDVVPNRIVVCTSWIDGDGDEWLVRANEPMPAYVWRGLLTELIED